MHRNLATALKNQGVTFKSFRARCCLSFAKARRCACSTECHVVPSQMSESGKQVGPD